MWRLIAAMVLGSQVTLVAAEGPPNLNAEPSCRAAADSPLETVTRSSE